MKYLVHLILVLLFSTGICHSRDLENDFWEDRATLGELGISFSSCRVLDMEIKQLGVVRRKSKLKSQLYAEGKYNVHDWKKVRFKWFDEWLTAYWTFKDEDDGGNSFGWIENAKGIPVAIINDSDISPLGGKFYDEKGDYRKVK